MTEEFKRLQTKFDKGKLEIDLEKLGDIEDDWNKVLGEIRDRGLMISGDIGSGKTWFARYLYQDLFNLKNSSIGVFDSLMNWCVEEFEGGATTIQYMNIDFINSVRRLYLPLSEGTVTRTYDIRFKSPKDRRFAVSEILLHTYNKQRVKKERVHLTSNLHAYIYFIEEAHLVLGTYALREGFLEEYFSTSRNFRISNIPIVQRLSEISTKIREKIPNIALGFTRGSNNLRQIKAISNPQTSKEVKKLGKYDFILLIGDKKYFARFNNNGEIEDRRHEYGY